jgi:hypothetical protein
VTEKFDNLIIRYLEKHPGTLYINLSSGAVYGKKIEKPLEITSPSIIDINRLDSGDYYAIAKLNAEAKHRALSNFNIADIRVFFFQPLYRFVIGFLMGDIILLSGTTESDSQLRRYHPGLCRRGRTLGSDEINNEKRIDK